MSLKLGELVAVLGVDADKFEAGLEKAKGKFSDFTEKLGPAAALAGGAAAVALATAFSSALEFDAAQTKLEAQLGNTAQADQLGRIAGDLYARGFGESLGEAMETVRASMMSGLIPKGADDGTIAEITRQVQGLGAAFDIDVKEAARAAGQMVKTGLAKNATEALDLVTAAFRETGDVSGDLIESITEYSVQFQKLGIDGQAALGLVQQGMQAGARDSDKVIDAVKEFGLRAVSGSEATSDALKSLGLDAKKVTDDIAAGGPKSAAAFDLVLDRLRTLGPDSKLTQQAVQNLFGGPGEDLGGALFALDLDKASDALGKVEGSAKSAADTLEGSVSQKMESLKRGVQQTLVEELEKALPTIQEMAQWLGENRDIVIPLAESLGILAIAIAAIVGAIKVWTVVQTALNVVMAMTPVGLIVLAIVALIAGIVLLWQNSEAFRNFWIGAWEMIKSAAIATWDWLVDAWNATADWFVSAWRATVKWIAGSWKWIKDAAGATKDWIVDKWNALLGWFKALPGRISRIASGMWNGIKDSFRNMINFLIGKWNNLSFTIGGGSFAGMDIPSATFGTPDLPYLASGGNVAGAGIAVVGERGRERVFLPEGASVQPLRPGQQAGSDVINIRLHVTRETPSGDVIRREVIEASARRGQSPAQFLKVAL